MKLRKAKARLKARQEAHDKQMDKLTPNEQRAFTRPGSLNGRK